MPKNSGSSPGVSSRTRSAQQKDSATPGTPSRNRNAQQQQVVPPKPTLDANLSLVLRQMFSIDSTASPVPSIVSALLRAEIYTWFDFVFITDLDILLSMTIWSGREELPLSKHNVMQLLNLKTIIDNNIFLTMWITLIPASTPEKHMLHSAFNARQPSKHILMLPPLLLLVSPLDKTL